jgi:ABC-type branched-subunit amino acid transport system permease subunit
VTDDSEDGDSAWMNPSVILPLAATLGVLAALLLGTVMGWLVLRLREKRRAVKLRPSTAFAVIDGLKGG